MLILPLIAFLTFIFYWYWSRQVAFRKRKRANVPGPPPQSFIGNVWEIAQFIWNHEQKQLGLFNHWKVKYGKVVGASHILYRLIHVIVKRFFLVKKRQFLHHRIEPAVHYLLWFFIGPAFNIMVEDLDMVKEILVTRFHNFEDRMFLAMCNSYPMNQSVMCLRGSDWKYARTVFTPMFSIRRMKEMCGTVSSKLDIFIHKLDDIAKQGETFDIQRVFQNLTLDVFGQCAFACDSKCQVDSSDPFYLACRSVFEDQDFEKSWLIRIAVLFPEFDSYVSMLRRFSNFGKSELWLCEGLKKIVEERKKSFKTFKGVDLVQLAVEAWDRDSKTNGTSKLTTDLIVANCFILLLAGYETSSTALSFCAWLLAKHQNYQQKLFEEISSHQHLQYDDLKELPYLDAFFKETLRMYPSVIYFLCRECVSPCTIKQYNFEAGDQIIIPVYNIHRDPALWPDPEKFDPQRFLEKTERHPMSYIPFGAGQRNCIGGRFADMECKMTIARMVQRFSLTLSKGSEDPLPIMQHGALLQPKNGIRIRIHKR